MNISSCYRGKECYQKSYQSVYYIKTLCWLHFCPTATLSSTPTKAFSQPLELQVHLTTAQGQKTLSSTQPHSPIGQYYKVFMLWLAGLGTDTGLCRVWQRLREVWNRGRQRPVGDKERYPLAVGAAVLCSAVYHLTLHNWVYTSTKWRSLWRPTDRGRGAGCYLSPVLSLFISVSVDRNGQTDSSASDGLLSPLPPYSL